MSKQIAIDLSESDHGCTNVLREITREQVENDFKRLASVIENDLEAAKLNLDQEIAEQKELRVVYDEETSERAYEMIREKLEEELPEYRGCLQEHPFAEFEGWSYWNASLPHDTEVKEAEAEIPREAEVPRKTKKSFLRKIFKCESGCTRKS